MSTFNEGKKKDGSRRYTDQYISEGQLRSVLVMVVRAHIVSVLTLLCRHCSVFSLGLA